MDVLLVSPPFASIARPSLGLSLLKGSLETAGYRCAVYYASMRLAALCGPEAHEWITEICPQEALAGEWLFSAVPVTDARLTAFERDVLVPQLGAETAARVWPSLLRLHAARGRFLHRCADDVLALNPRIVGFSTTFQQTNAALLLAAIVKVRRPDTIVVFGGANCEGEMGEALLDAYSCIDVVFGGAAERTLPQFVDEALRHGRRGPRRYMFDGGVECLDDLPFPNFDDYFTQLRDVGLSSCVVPGLVMEASRGCYWGAHAHCAFCGLNGQTMRYRRKSPGRLLDEVRALTSRYQCRRVEFVDADGVPRLPLP